MVQPGATNYETKLSDWDETRAAVLWQAFGIPLVLEIAGVPTNSRSHKRRSGTTWRSD